MRAQVEQLSLQQVVRNPQVIARRAGRGTTATGETAAIMLDDAAAPPGATDAQQAALRELKIIGRTLLATNLIFVIFLTTLLIILGVAASQLASSVADIADTISPATVSQAVASVQATLDAGFDSADNLRHFTSSTSSMGVLLVDALNGTTALIEKANLAAENLLEHPRVEMILGGAGGGGT